MNNNLNFKIELANLFKINSNIEYHCNFMLILTWSESMPAAKNFLDSKAPSIPSEIFECLTLYKNNQQKHHTQIF